MYSRPSTRQVNALFDPAKPMAMPSPQEMRTTVTASGRLLDYSTQRFGNETNTAGEISKFLGGLIEPAAKITGAILRQQGAQQAGDFLKTADVGELYRSGDEQQRAALRTMNPFARDIVNDAAARSTSQQFITTLAAERAINPVLNNPYASDEDRAEAEAKLRGTALERSGIQNVPSTALVPYLPGLADTEGRLKGESFNRQAVQQKEDQDTQFRDGLQVDLRAITELRRNFLGALEAGAVGADGWDKAFPKERLQQYHDQLLQGGFYTSKELATQYGLAIQSEYQRRLGNEDILGAHELISTVAGMVENRPVKTPGGVDLWAIPISENGESVKALVSRLQAGIGAKYEQWQREQQIKSFGPDLVAAAQGDAGARGRIDALLPRLANDPQALAQVVSMSGAMQNYGDRPTEAQLQEQALLEIELNIPGRDWNATNQRILGSSLTTQQKISMLNRNRQPQDPVLSLTSQAISQSTPDLEQIGLQVITAKAGAGLLNAEDKTAVQNEMNGVLIKARTSTETRIRDLQAAGEAVTPIKAAQIFREELEVQRDAVLKDIKSGQANPLQSFDAFGIQMQNEVQQRINSTNGKGTIGWFPQPLLQRARAAGVPQTYKDVSKWYVNNFLPQIKDPQGNPAFPNARKAYQDMIRNAQQQQGEQLRQQSYQGVSPTGRMASELGIEQMIDRSGLRQPTPAGGDQSSAKPKQQQGGPQQLEQLIGSGLDILMGVQPAVAATTADNTAGGKSPSKAPPRLNTESLEVMARLWSGHQRMSTTTPPLPQVVGTAPTQRLPLQLSQNHPIFIAIGIAEGTRTASGGFTSAYGGHRDPGDGHWNRGTVSGGRGGNASPAQVDRQWTGRLTQVAVSVAPALQRLGLRPGTAAYDRVLFNVLDLNVQAPAAAGDFVRKLPQVMRAGATIEAIAKARADSFINPRTGRLDTSFNSYSALLRDQRSRAGAYDYKRRL